MLHMSVSSAPSVGLLSGSLTAGALVAAALIVFPNGQTADHAARLVSAAPAHLIAVVGRPLLERAKARPGMPVDVDLIGSEATGLLIEVTGTDRDDLEDRIGAIASCLWELPTVNGVRFSHDPHECGRFHAIWDDRPVA